MQTVATITVATCISYCVADLSNFMTTPMSQLKHSLNTIYVLVDLFANAMPVRLYHVVYPLALHLASTMSSIRSPSMHLASTTSSIR